MPDLISDLGDFLSAKPCGRPGLALPAPQGELFSS